MRRLRGSRAARLICCIALVFPALAACGDKQVAPSSATGSAAPSSGSAERRAPAPSVSTACVPRTHKLADLVVDDTTATLCSVPNPQFDDKTNPQRLFDDEIKPPQPQCMVAELATGSWREAKAPAPRPRPGAYEVKQDSKGVRVCKAAACTELAVPPAKRGHAYAAAVSDDGTRAVVVADALKGAWWFDATTGAKVGELAVASPGTSLESGPVVFLGDRLYLAGTLYDRAGTPSGKLDLGPVTAAELVALGGEVYAIARSSLIKLVNARTATTREVELQRAPAYLRASRGALIALDASTLSVIDPATGTIQAQHPVPTCPTTAAGPAAASQPALVLFGEHALGRIGNRLIQFGLGGEPGQPAPAELLGSGADDAGVIAGVGDAAYAVTRASSTCRNLHGDPRDWTKLGDGPEIPLEELRLEAAEPNDGFWATSSSSLYKLTQHGRRAVRVSEFPQLHQIVRSEPTRLLVLDLTGEPEPGTDEVKPENVERRLSAVDKATGEATELLRGSNLRFPRVVGTDVWIVRDGTELLSLAVAATEPTPRATLPEPSTSIEVSGDTVYFIPTAGDRVLAMPIAGGATRVVADHLATAEILGASAERLFLGVADAKAQARIDRERAAPPPGEPPMPFPHQPAKRILSVAKAGGAIKVLASELETIRGAVSDADHIYVNVVICYDDPDNDCSGLEAGPAIWVVDKRANRARRMGGVTSCKDQLAVAGAGVWLGNGVRLDQRTAAPVFLRRGFPSAAVGLGDDLFLAMDHQLVRANATGHEVLAEVAADALAIGGSYLYFHDPAGARIGRIATRTGKLETLVANLPSVAAMAADIRGVYWWAGGSQPIEAATAPGARRTVLANAGAPIGLAANDGRLAVLSSKQLVVVAEDGAARTLALGAQGAGVACDDHAVYWTEDADDGVLQRAAWAGGAAQILSRLSTH